MVYGSIMIWVGRLVSIPLGLVLFVLLVVTLVLLRASDTFLDPGFYPRELEKAEIYEFVLNDLLTSALDDARELDPAEFSGDLSGEIDENPLLTSGLTTQRIVGAINRAVPPEYVQDLVEQSFDQLGRYITGERDEFEFTLRAGEQVATMVEELKALLAEADAYNLLFERAVDPRIEESIEFELPLGVELPSDRLVEAVRRIVPPDWVQDQVEGAIDEVTPYLIGERDSFEIRVELADRVEIALEEVKAILREVDAYELLYSEVVEPRLLESLGAVVDLPFGVSITKDEVLAALRQVAPPEWVQQQAEMLIDDVGPYLTGKADGFSTEISLVENKRLASRVISDLVNLKVTETVDALPQCRTRADAVAAIRGGTGGLPSCIPADVSVRQLLDRSGIDIAAAIRQSILGPIPNRIRFTDTQIRSALEQVGVGDNLELVDDVREVLRDGWTYTDEDLRRDLDRPELDAADALEDIRSFLADGWTYTHVDLREDLAGLESDGTLGGGTASAVSRLDQTRDAFKTSRRYRWVVYLPLILLLVVIGFLGGRGWAGRVIWAASFLLVFAGVIFLVTGPLYGVLASSGLASARAEALEGVMRDAPEGFHATFRLAGEKGLDVVESVADEFVSGIRGASLNLAIIALLAIAAAIFWQALIDTMVRLWPEKRP